MNSNTLKRAHKMWGPHWTCYLTTGGGQGVRGGEADSVPVEEISEEQTLLSENNIMLAIRSLLQC